MSYGPQRPPHLANNKITSQEDGPTDSGNDAYRPALPPHLAKKKYQQAQQPIGRSPSPIILPKTTTLKPSVPPVQEDSDSDDGFGPPPPTAGPSMSNEDAVREFKEREQRRKELAKEAKKPASLKRQEWMLAPPSASDLLSSIDTTKIRARQFSRATGREEVSKDTTLWTETPAERQQRLADELSGKRKRATADLGPSDGGLSSKRVRRDIEIREQVKRHNEMARPQTLLESHQASVATTKDPKDDVIWDRERDLAAGRVMDSASRAKYVKDAKGLGDRFGVGRQGRYDD